MPALHCLNCDARLQAGTPGELQRLVDAHAKTCHASMAFLKIPDAAAAVADEPAGSR